MDGSAPKVENSIKQTQIKLSNHVSKIQEKKQNKCISEL